MLLVATKAVSVITAVATKRLEILVLGVIKKFIFQGEKNE